MVLAAERALTRPLVRGGQLILRDVIVIAWFTVLTGVMIVLPIVQGLKDPLGFDAVIYTEAARALLAGGDPWHVTVFNITYAAPPPSLIPFLPYVPLPNEVVGPASVVVAAACGLYSLRKLRLPLWWLLFPPLALGIVIGSSTMIVLALLVRGGAVADGLAIVARVYAALPLFALGRWRGLVAGAAMILVSAPFLAWPTFLSELDHVGAVIRNQSNGGGSLSAAPLLIPLALVFLALLGRRRAAWLIVPVFWPDAQLHYSSIALPILVDAPVVALSLALPWSPLLVVAGLGGQVAAERTVGWARSIGL
jgi:hypothetical protein